MKSNYDISVVVPLYNEHESLLELFNHIASVIVRMRKSFEVIFVDDGSLDNSSEVISELHTKDKRAKLIQFRKNFGKSAALAVGFAHCQGRYVITIDADLQDDPEEIPALIAKLEQGYDLASGWKKHRKDPFRRRVASRFYNLATSIISGIKLHDFNCGLKAYRREVVESLDVYGEMHRYLPVLAHRQGFRVAEIVVRHHSRKYGKTKYGTSRYSRGFFDLLTVTFLTRYKQRPMHLFGIIGVLSFVTGMVISAVLAYQRIFANQYLSNRPLLFLGILMIIVGIQFISLGLIGEMITEMRKRHDTYAIRQKVGWPKLSKNIFEPLPIPEE
jgi:glycosyltransferase involved in cell wall biosynthesis